MKRIITWLTYMLVCLATTALLAQQAPQSFTYQAVARNNDGSPITTVTPFKISILQGSPTGTEAYSETCNLLPNQFGLVTVPVGASNPGGFASINWGADDYYLKIEVDMGSGYQQMGEPELIRSVPYALYGQDADADPNNEVQQLGLTGQTLSITNGNSVTLPPDSDNQLLSISGDQLGISNGNTVTLPASADEQTLSVSGSSLSITNGNTITLPDADATNELQTISLTGSDLNLSNGGGSVSLSSFATPWSKSSSNIYYAAGRVGVGYSSPQYPLDVRASSSVGYPNGVITAAYTGTNATDVAGVKGFSRPTDNYGIGGHFEGGYKGVYAVNNPTGSATYYGLQAACNGGSGNNYGVYGAASGSGTKYAIYGYASGTGTNWAGYFNGDVFTVDLIKVSGTTQDPLVTLGEYSSSNSGHVMVRGPSHNPNVFIGYYVNADRGNIRVADNNGSYKAGMHVNSSNQGYVWGDIKSFRMEYPGRSGQEIWYASIEGPEAAAYERGTATLANGEVFVAYSETFEIVVNPETVTITLTPHSADTYGLAVVQKEADGFRVKELKAGNGNFSFDYTVMGVRKGYEDFEVVRQAERPMPEQ